MKKVWNVEIENLPGRDRERWPGEDYYVESPSGEYLALLYSVIEQSMCFYVGNLAIYAGPPNAPTCIFGSERFPALTTGWLTNNVLMAKASIGNRGLQRVDYPFVFFNISTGGIAIHTIKNAFYNYLSVDRDGVFRVNGNPQYIESMEHDGKLIQLSSIRWDSWNELDAILARY